MLHRVFILFFDIIKTINININKISIKSLLTLILVCLVTFLSAQEADRFTENTDDRLRYPLMDPMNFVFNEVLVKFKDEVAITSGTQIKSVGITAVDKVLRANGVTSIENLFVGEKKLKAARIVKDPTGQRHENTQPAQYLIYKISVPQLKSTGAAPSEIFKLMEEMKALAEVKYAEPNYIFSIGDFTSAGKEMTLAEAKALPGNDELSGSATGSFQIIGIRSDGDYTFKGIFSWTLFS